MGGVPRDDRQLLELQAQGGQERHTGCDLGGQVRVVFLPQPAPGQDSLHEVFGEMDGSSRG